ncbi:glycosyltransferase [Leptolyngbya sp. FACHB-321]|uniref:glycosyltransferase n=1 Tax=Leptolyngbya sp. FACHB-321 TaxID=2692807 RepID=UPI001683C0C7|nr:glycosyltransferase [Leptolyngbya sp. FACHB-321]MBD2038536.1 glycosyltransferase [Leptolyngbya sp. FACHB-321]
MSDSSNLFVSVIIPVFNDSERLKLCLQALKQQTYPEDCYEVIVVDNNSHEDIKSVVTQFNQVLLTHESRPGSYIARNTGLTLANGAAIAFTDVDCIPDPAWIEKGVAALLSTPNVGLVAGRIDLFCKDANNPNPVELYDSIALSFPQDKFIEDGKFGVTANLFTFRRVIDAVGMFDETLMSGGDRQWGERVFAKGYEQIYADDARVRHPARDSWDDLLKRSIRIIGGKYDLMRQNTTSDLEALKDLILFLKPPFRSFFRIWTDQRLHGTKQKVQFTTVMLRLRWVAIQERLRLQLGGGISDRG